MRTLPLSGGASGRPAAPSYEFGPFRLDVAEHLLLRDGHPLPLTPKVFEVLRVLVQHSGRLVERDALLQEVWPDSFVEEGALSRSVSVLRKALGENAAGAEYIETVPKRGYRFVAPVTLVADEAPSDAAAPAQPAATSWRATGFAAAVLTFAVLAIAVLEVDSSNRREPYPIAPVHRQVTSTGTARAPAISPDGTRMAYVSDVSPHKTLMVQAVADGQALALFSAPEVGHLRWSPDGSDLLVWARGSEHNGLYVVSSMGGTPRLIAADRYLGSWSPDGSTIAVPNYLGGSIRFFDTRGRVLRTIELRGALWSIWDIDWSHVNGMLTMVSNDQQRRYTIWTVRADGSDQRQVLTDDAEISAARWASQANAIYFSRRIDQTVSIEKILVSPDVPSGDASVTPVLTGLETDGSLSVSAAGTRLLYTRSSFHSNLWRLDVDGRATYSTADATPLTSATALVERPDISPDARTVVFNIGREPKAELYTMPLAGGAPTQLTHLDAFTLGGVWSADGRSIAFTSTKAGPPRAWMVDAGGTVLRALASVDASDTFDIAWAPASRILFHQPGNRNFHDVDPRTREQRLLVGNSEVGWMFSPVASPDGRQVAVYWNRPSDRGIWIINAANGDQRLIYRTSMLTTMPVRWSADGRAIYAVEGKPSAARGLTARLGESLTDVRILRVPVDGGAVQTVAVLPFEEVGGVSITPNGRTLVCAVYSSTPSDVWVVDHVDGASGRD